MRLLLPAKNQILPREVILFRILSNESNAVENHVEVCVDCLCQKPAAIGANVRIQTLRRTGYCLEVD